MHLFYIPKIKGDRLSLNEVESKHCVRVLRLTEGDKVQLVDGTGGFFDAEIEHANPKKCALKILTKQLNSAHHPYYLHIAIAPTKSIDRMEWFLEKSTEIGIDEITPLLCRYSERKNLKPERLKSILVSAMKQSLKAYLPSLNELTNFKDFIVQPFEGKKFIAHCYEGQKIALKTNIQPEDKMLILIGPEGDFSEEEVELAKANGFTEITLGKSRLRTETAGVVACHTVNLICEG